MKSLLFLFAIALSPLMAICQKTQACPEFSPWEKLMKKENYEEAARLANMVFDYKEPNSWDKKDFKLHGEYHKIFNRDKNYLCARYYMAEPYRIKGDLTKAVEIFSNNYNDGYSGDEGFMLHRFIHYSMELGERELARGNLDLAQPPLQWAAEVGQLKIGECSGYPNEQSKNTHPYVLTESLGDLWAKKENYALALKFYALFDSSKYSSQISTKISTAKLALANANNNFAELENQKKVQLQKDESTLPTKFNPSVKRTAGLVATGNISIKINNSNEPISQKQKEQWEYNDLVFNASGDELYYKNYVDSTYLIWDVKNKVKLAEIAFADLDKTEKGRSVAASFFPYFVYAPPANGIFERWISSDMKLIIDNQEEYIIKNQKGEQIHSFQVPKVVNSFWLENLKIQAYYYAALNKLFIYKLEENKKKEFASSLSVYVYDLNKKQLRSLYKKSTYYPNATRWLFNNNKLMLQVVDSNTDFFIQGIWTYDLAVLKGEELTYDYQIKQKETFGVTGKKYVGSDLAHRDYFIDYSKKGFNELYIQYGSSKPLSIVSLYPSSSAAYLSNIKVDPNGNNFAYYELFYQPGVGNFVSINLYDVNKPDQIYTLTDQTKYPVLLGKNYVTSKENADFLWDRGVAKAKADTKLKEELAKAEAEKNRLKAEELAQKELVAKQAAMLLEQKKEKNRQLYKREFDSLQVELKKVSAEIQANKDREINWFKEKNYRQILISKKWEFTVLYQRSIKYGNQVSATDYDFTIKHEIEFKDNGPQSLEVICKSTYAIPTVSFDYGNNGEVLHPRNKTYLNSAYQYVTLNSTNNAFKMEQHTFPISIKPLPANPFTDKDEALNKIRAKWVLEQELYIRKRSFLLRMNPGAQIELVLIEEDGTSYRTIDPIYSDHEYDLRNKSRDLTGLINKLENR